MSTPITVRPAVLDDMPTLLQFEQGVIRAERPFDSTLDEDPINYYDLHQLITAPHSQFVVAQVGDKLIGSGYARIEASKPYLKHRHCAYLGFMFVAEAWRGKGINKLILDALKDWAISMNITELRLEVYDENEPALKAYEKAGFSRLLVEMRMGL